MTYAFDCKGRAWDIIGDVHGCYFELTRLLHELGYQVTEDRHVINVTCPPGRVLGFVGDLIKRGPYSARVLALVMRLVAQGKGVSVPGNHDEQLKNRLLGKPTSSGKQIDEVVRQVETISPNFSRQTRSFLAKQRSIYVNSMLIMVHAAYKEEASGWDAFNLAVHGKARNEDDQENWERHYKGSKTIVHGHEPVDQPTVIRNANGGCVINVDTGCCLGNKLTALRFPEMEFVSVPAYRRYFTPR